MDELDTSHVMARQHALTSAQREQSVRLVVFPLFSSFEQQIRSLYPFAYFCNGNGWITENADSDDARKLGHVHFAKKAFPQALEAYLQSTELDPKDYRPLWNASAVYFELGDYQSATHYAQKALGAIDDKGSDTALKVQTRGVRSLLHLRHHDEASAMIKALGSSEEQKDLDKALQAAIHSEDAKEVAWIKNGRSARHLPYCKPGMFNIPEFYTVGHDKANSMYDYLLMRQTGPSEKIAFLFGDIGDARHLFKTLTAIDRLEVAKRTDREYHFTIIDIKPEVLARDLLFFLLLDQLASELRGSNTFLSGKVDSTLATLYYAYVSQVMPPKVYQHLQDTIVFAIDALESRTAMPSWIVLRESDHGSIIATLRSWQTEAIKKYPAYRFIQNAHKARAQSIVNRSQYGAPPEEYGSTVSKERDLETKDYGACCMLLPPSSALDEDLKKILDLPATSNDRSRRLQRYTEDTWKPNVTLVDLNYVLQGRDLLDVGHDAMEFAETLYDGCVWPGPKRTTKLYDFAKGYFLATARGISGIRDRLTIEARSGEIGRILEGIRYGHMNDRDPSYPTTYDRIHLSNIPDYVGGTLFKYIYALPLLKSKASSFACSNCLRNPHAFSSLALFDNEYTRLPDASSVEKVFKVKVTQLEEMKGTLFPKDDEDIPAPLRDMMASLMGGSGGLLTREETETWLYGLFLKIALPTHRPNWNHMELVYSPLNLSMFFRILSTLFANGYPAHWLADILVTIATNRMQTTTRPPRSCPLDIAETKKIHPLKYVDISPFTTEFRTLTGLWLGELPFGLATSVSVPPPSRIREYSIRFSDTHWQGEERNPVFALLFTELAILKLF
ncbi:hypothetical protein BDV95DRAFT_619358 [Massariosphaeria phaeospora]|uniref:DUF4470 domain-containing protein n=1 Tax=Massariosphaeria phaeospora TaxID=100035 RepID=A0A7C8IA68_9PLEO|nr:hypothetical protein BDV95DRAFT_619358 [Massariosphaeria phaeospora]